MLICGSNRAAMSLAFRQVHSFRGSQFARLCPLGPPRHRGLAVVPFRQRCVVLGTVESRRTVLEGLRLMPPLMVGLGLLILAPVQVFKLQGCRPALAFVAYLATFGLGALRNAAAKRSRGNARVGSLERKKHGLPPLIAPLAILGLHWAAVWEGARHTGGGWITPLIAVGAVSSLGGACLNLAALSALGRNFASGGLSKAQAPESLVINGAYSFVRHPVYTSYIFLFAGCFMFLGAPFIALVAAAVGCTYYSYRATKEDTLLASIFGMEHAQYCASTRGQLLPHCGKLLDIWRQLLA